MRKPIGVGAAVCEFYMLEALDVVAQSGLKNTPSHRRWRMELEALKSEFEKKLALAFRDYIATACFGEARHTYANCSGVHPVGIPKGNSRTGAAEVARQYTPESVLYVTERVFMELPWNRGSFGGKKWGNIATCGRRYGNVPDAVFIDNVVNLSHNGGIAFNKSDYNIFNIDYGDYTKLLDDKRQLEPKELIKSYAARVKDGSRLGALMESGRSMGLDIPESAATKDKLGRSYSYTCPAELEVLGYEKIEWGTTELEFKLDKSSSWGSTPSYGYAKPAKNPSGFILPYAGTADAPPFLVEITVEEGDNYEYGEPEDSHAVSSSSAPVGGLSFGQLNSKLHSKLFSKSGAGDAKGSAGGQGDAIAALDKAIAILSGEQPAQASGGDPEATMVKEEEDAGDGGSGDIHDATGFLLKYAGGGKLQYKGKLNGSTDSVGEVGEEEGW